ncbi:UDP-N-acetylmuramate dehydrogenase [Clostridium sp. Marseille-Q2269]|uniref:UDP-N-acetylmuramate dehydrogenase n=1 Tax=Clostridium sp. Marseille-Q2269 TaxID=2942205 RepID=UPI00207450E5|nr:UDP-N-acetylmuramate dehydrogenase [Clostridium sp. Marseille-Q2269]
MNQYKNFNSQFKDIVGDNNILIDEPMKNHTSFKVGGPADILITPTTLDAVKESIILCKDNNIPYYIIGNGSNLLVRDGGIRGVVIKFSKLDYIKVEGDKVIAQSGAPLTNVCNEALKSKLAGLEFACGIPGSIGGAVTMNAGAYNGEISQVIESAKVIDKAGKVFLLDKEQLDLGYRMSAIQKYHYIVLEVTLGLHNGEYDTIKNRIMDLNRRRTEKQPLEYPSAGSTFKRPEGHFAAKLIEDTGLKGSSVGGAQVSEKHSGFIINKGNATAVDILNLIEFVQNKVKEKFQVELHTEVRIIGEENN